MSNRIRGRHDFEADGKTWSLHFTANGMCELEDAVGCGVLAFLKRIEAAGEDISFRDVRLLFWAGLQEHHPDIDLRGAGALITALGGIAQAMELTGQAVADSMPKPDAPGDGAKGKKTKGTS
ncbi:GTA-gp10 family protein [Primorskyibacter sp. 2E107]|uniref:GTA-gp10 family protein n=1 Tax=Primorskyibacter sp. 2E107 TaxID=3403458 RepID=UPI003AF86DB9